MSTRELVQKVSSPVGCGSVRLFQAGLVDGISYPQADLLSTGIHDRAFHLGQRLGRRCAR